MSNPIFFAEPSELAALNVGDSYSLAGAEGRHAVTVKRITAGESIDLCDGEGLRLVCTATDAAAGVLQVMVDQAVREPVPEFELVLVQALAKGDRDELAIEMATELGVDGVVPWQAERSIVRWKADKAAKGLAKWRNVVSTAAKQARRSRIPWVGELVGTAALLKMIEAADLSLILHEEARASVRQNLDDWLANSQPGSGDVPRRILMIVGPEGGMSAGEVDAFVAAGARRSLLGRHVLRSSTAGPAAVVLLSDQLGRW